MIRRSDGGLCRKSKMLLTLLEVALSWKVVLCKPSDPVLNFERFLIRERVRVAQILHFFFHRRYVDFDLIKLSFSSLVRSLVGEYFCFVWLDCESLLFGTSFEISHHRLELAQ